jgi:hypothetical protein
MSAQHLFVYPTVTEVGRAQPATVAPRWARAAGDRDGVGPSPPRPDVVRRGKEARMILPGRMEEGQ